MKNICNQKGITMVVLIVTIIVMLILAATVLVVAFDADDGVIGEAKKATSDMTDFSLYECIAELIVTSKKKNGKINSDTFPDKVNNIDDNISCSYNEDESKYTVTVDGVEKYEVSDYGKITEK